jgi:DNA (cytosine-5)-methyltransferase 1
MPAGDIAGVDPNEVPDHDVAVAGLPCVPFSVLGRKRGLDDPRSGVLHSVLRLLAAKRPRAVLLENVPALARQHGGRALRFMAGCLRGLGYAVSWSVLDASSFGAAQRQQRLFVVASRGSVFDFSTIPTRPPGRLRDLLDDVDDGWLDPGEYTLLDPPRVGGSGLIFAGFLNRPLRVPGGNPRSPGTHRHTNMIWAAEGLGPTLCSGDDMGRYHVLVGGRVRKLTTPERCRLMGFPAYFAFHKPAKASVQLGNSVYVPCVAGLAREVSRQVVGVVAVTA